MRKDAELLAYWKGNEPRERNQFLRTIKFGTEDKILIHLTLLLNVDGQQYTLGTYKGREVNGEFIFLQPKPPESVRNQWEETPTPTSDFCEISVDKNEFYLEPARWGHPVVLNKVQIFTKTLLKFGDTFGNGSDAFLFREREFITSSPVPEAEKEGPENGPKTSKPKIFTVQFTPGQNELILSHILSFMSITELKCFRFVSKSWNIEAFRHLKKLCDVSFYFSHTLGEVINGYSLHPKSLRLLQYSVEMETSPMPNWTITLPSLRDIPTPGTVGAKLLDDLNHFIISPKPEYIRKLELCGNIRSEFDLQLQLQPWEELLQALGGTLQELELGWTWLLDYWPANYAIFPENITFPKLQVFKLSMAFLEGGDANVRDCSDVTWLQNVVTAVRCVTRIELLEDTPPSTTFLEHLSQVSVMFVNLQEIVITYVCPDVIRALLKVEQPQPLKKLELEKLEYMEKEDYPAYQELLRKHSKSLELLKFSLAGTSTKSTTDPIRIRFPTCPKLTRLEVEWSSGDPDAQGNDIRLVFPDGRASIDYEKHLPSLKSLTVSPVEFIIYSAGMRKAMEGGWRKYASFYEMFFPSIAENYKGTMQVCKSLQILDVPIPDRISPQFSNILTRLAGLFPNASNPKRMTALREAAKLTFHTSI